TLEIVREVRFDAAFTFVYSPRPGTCASFYEDSISSKVKIGWVNELIKLQMEITKGKNREHIGRLEEVMIEGVSKKDPEKLTARTRGYKNVILKGKEGLIGSFLNVKIVDARGWALFGEPIGD
ncbi:MAG: TRAM domain-containing protein, partial [Elusimicrobiota bacterium]